MTNQENFELTFSAHRLRGELPPHDLSLLLAHRHELASLTGIVLEQPPCWAPWLDTSYLKDDDWANPDIRANVKAIHEVCKMIDFVIEDDEGNYLGYWRGPEQLPLSQAPVVCLNSEGQFDFCGTASLAGAILTRAGRFEDLQAWLVSIGIEGLPSDPYDLIDVEYSPSPRQRHHSLFEKYSAEERTV